MKFFHPKLVSMLLISHAAALWGEVIQADICIYGGTSAGVAAALQAARMGQQAVIVEPGKYLGGLSSGGLGATDIGNKRAIGGISREFYQRIGQHYGKPEQWTFEPHVAAEIFQELVKESRTAVYYAEPLARVKKNGRRISEIRTASGRRYRARVYIDATYEGDLLAKAGVSFTVGREPNDRYGERLNGVHAETPKHQFTVAVDPYIKPGDPTSGLLPYIQAGGGEKPGAGDRRIQAYNYRLCFTTNVANRGPLPAPAGYDPGRYELLARYLEALQAAGKRPKLSEFWNPIAMPNGKTDINNNGPFSTDFIGGNYDYPNGDFRTRARIARAHQVYTKGFLRFLATSPRVPEEMRAEMQTWGPCLDEFQDTGGWPHALYVREARRMVSDYVMTERDCRGQRVADDSIGLAAYNMDSHNCRRVAKGGRAENEGDVQVPPMQPYPISYRSIVPPAGQCENLLVPVCLSATHIAYGSIRMEPVFMVLGQSAATAAALAIDARLPVQNISIRRLQAKLLGDGQVLSWTPVNVPP